MLAIEAVRETQPLRRFVHLSFARVFVRHCESADVVVLLAAEKVCDKIISPGSQPWDGIVAPWHKCLAGKGREENNRNSHLLLLLTILYTDFMRGISSSCLFYQSISRVLLSLSSLLSFVDLPLVIPWHGLFPARVWLQGPGAQNWGRGGLEAQELGARTERSTSRPRHRPIYYILLRSFVVPVLVFSIHLCPLYVCLQDDDEAVSSPRRS